MPRLIFERALSVTEDGEYESYWPERATFKYLAKELVTAGSAFFAASYQNDPSGLEGNVLKATWVNFYLPGELEAARKLAKIDHGVRHVGIDPANGGQSNDTDFCSMTSGELIGHKLYLLDNYYKRLKLELQAQAMEDWMDLWQPSFCKVEDTSAKGYVYVALTTQVNDGKGTKYSFEIEKPQGRSAVGNKMVRFLSMAPRFENAQVLVPGRMQPNGQIVPMQRWEGFMDQWRSFPAGHDDTLDSTYWCVYSAFKIPQAVGVAKDPRGNITSQHMPDGERKQDDVIYDDRGRVVHAIGTPYNRPRRISMLRGRYNR